MVRPALSADYYKDQNISSKRIGNTFAECMFEWNFPGQLLEPKNDSILTDIEYSFDGVMVAGRLRHGTDAQLGGESYEYENTHRQKIYLRRATGEGAAEPVIPYRLWVNREMEGGR